MASSLYGLAGKPNPCASQPVTIAEVQQVVEADVVVEAENASVINELSNNSVDLANAVLATPEEQLIDTVLDAIPVVVPKTEISKTKKRLN